MILRGMQETSEMFEKILVQKYSSPLEVSIWIIMKVLKNYYSYIVLFNVSTIYSCNMTSSGIKILHSFMKF